MARVGIVIVNYNGGKYQNDCIKSLYEMSCTDFEVIVVDNASTDDSIARLKESYPAVHVIEFQENAGVAKGNNIGIKYSRKLKMEYTLLMNNDVELHPEMLIQLLTHADENTVTVPKIFYYAPSDLLWYAGGQFEWNKGGARHYGLQEKDNGAYDEMKEVDYASTCCMLLHNSIFEKIGMIDEDLFMYYDDADLCMKLHEANVAIQYVPSAKMWHKVSSSTGGEHSKLCVYYQNRNQLYFMRKYRKYLKFSAYPYVLCKAAAKVILFPVRHKNDRYIVNAYMDYLHGKMGKKVF